MAVNFPSSPTIGQQVVGANNVVYEWDGEKWKSANNIGPSLFGISSGVPPSGASNGDAWFDTESGRAYVYYIDDSSAQWIDMSPTWNGTITDGTVTPEKLSSGGPSWTASGDFSVDTNTLYVDATNNRVGLGTSSPITSAHIYRNTTDGTASEYRAENAGTTGSYSVFRAVAGTAEAAFYSDAGGNVLGATGATLRTVSNHPLYLGTNNTTRLTITNGGNVGIGTTSPVQRLHLDSSSVDVRIALTNSATGSSNTDGCQIQYNSNDLYINNQEAGIIRLRTNNADVMEIDSSGRVTMPYQPAFSAYINSGQSISAHSITKVLLNATEFNIGNSFDSSASRFNAPVTGVYLFTAAIQYEAVGAPHTNLYKNGTTFVDGWLDFGSGAKSSSQSRIMYLNAGEFIELYAYSAANTTMSINRTRMTGHLIA